MQSIKNTAVSIVLLFLSYGVYQVITKPLPSDSRAENQPLADLEIMESDSESMDSMAIAENLKLGPPSEGDAALEIPQYLLDSELPDSKSFSKPDVDSSAQFASEDFGGNFEPPAGQTFPVSQASSQEVLELISANDSSQDIQFASPTQNQPLSTKPVGQSFDSDVTMVPTTDMGSVSERPQENASPSINELQPAQDNIATQKKLSDSWPRVSQWVKQAKFQEALQELSCFYRDQTLTNDERKRLLDWLVPRITRGIEGDGS